ncbi:hypothetical protein BGZ57DRAFT_953391 [Hyaloscypha finlandica]|nr:hypothetical protein BGZ57DRAFT_953391 [Hyaloscypha finlandica]
MASGFRFSAGDFVSALSLVATVIDALRESGESSSEYRALVTQLHTLESALLRVKTLEIDDSQQRDFVIALQQAAAQCQTTIDSFWQRIRKYQPHLGEGRSGSRVRDGWMKIKWAMCKRDDLVKFKMDLVGHTESIEMLLTTLQFVATRIDSKRSEQQHQTLAGKVQDSYFGCMQKVGLAIEKVSIGIQQGKQLLDMTAKVIQTNIQIFQIVLNLQNVITRIPGQLERQQPVYLVDAIGRHMPFHLEFVLSAEASSIVYIPAQPAHNLQALISVLQANFKNVGSGAKKVRKGEFAIQDAATKMDIDLNSPWETCFTPGQHIEMSMVFSFERDAPELYSLYCPKCGDPNRENAAMNKDIEW